MSDPIIKINNLSKTFKVRLSNSVLDFFRGKRFKKKNINALDDISLNIQRGESVGILGVNGAGKSTLIKIMTGILLQSSGEIEVLNNNPFKRRNENSYHIGAVFGQRCQLKWDLSPMDSYHLFQTIYKIPKDEFEKRLNLLIDALQIGIFINQQVRTLSLGQKMRAELAGAFLHNPDIIFLDEPTLGLDVFSKEAIINFLNKWKENNKTTIIFTSHDMEDVKKICDRIIIINDGKKIYDNSIENFCAGTDLNTLVKIKIVDNDLKLSEELCRFKYSFSDSEITFFVDKQSDISHVINKITQSNNVSEIDIQKPQFSDIFMEIFKK